MKRMIGTLVVVLATILSLSGCTATPEGHPGSPSAVSGALSDIEYWAYQIQDQTADDNLDLLAESDYELLVIDQTRSLLGEPGYDSAGDVVYLKDGLEGRIVVCYWDVGQAESYRWYWEDDWEIGDPAWIVAEDPDGWDENYPVVFWDPDWQDIMLEGLDMIIDDGYDGVYLDWLEIYDFEPVVERAEEEGLDPEEELVAFVELLAEHARERDPEFLFIAQNAAEMGRIPAYRDVFDAVAQEAVWFDGEGDPNAAEQAADMFQDEEWTLEYLDDLEIWLEEGILVLDVEYAIEPGNAAEAYRLSDDEGFVPYVTTRPLAQLTDTPPPGY